MFLKKINIKNYRNFNDFSMSFQEGLNVILGPNNAGKTGLLHAIQLLNKPNTISFNDFNKNNLLKYKEKYIENAPEIVIEYYINHTIIEDDVNDESIIKLLPFLGIKDLSSNRENIDGKTSYKIDAAIKAVFSLDIKYLTNYQNDIKDIDDFDTYLLILKNYVEKYYSWEYTNGVSETKLDQKLATNIFDINYIEAERTQEDVLRATKREIEKVSQDDKSILKLSELKIYITNELQKILEIPLKNMSELFENENNDIGLKKGNVSIESVIQPNITLADSYNTEVKDTKSGFIIPISNNGLGYNNLINIYMLIKLNEVQNGKDFKILCLEEPEAHLHPAMQYKLFKYLRDLDQKNNLKQQIFVTTHSSNISAVAGIDNIFMMAYDRSVIPNDCVQQSLKLQFTDDQNCTNKIEAKNHLTKFLDVTKSDMLFADKVILVEGIAEKLLLPIFMEKLGIPYENENISIVEIGGKHFEYFIELFNGNKVKKKVLCITDRDFKWLNFELNEYKNFKKYITDKPQHIEMLNNRFKFNEFNICTQKIGGRTFEDELFLSNIHNDVFLNNIYKYVNNQLFVLYQKYGNKFKKWSEHANEIDGRSLDLFKKYFNLFDKLPIYSSKKFYNNLFISQLFLHLIKKNKGDFALEILSNNVFYKDKTTILNVPKYIKEGLEWLVK